MSVTTPNVNSQSVFPYGEPLVSRGLFNRDAVDGFGLLSFGFLWELQAIWIDTNLASNLSTGWTARIGVTMTSWTRAAGSSIATSWTSPRFGTWGEY